MTTHPFLALALALVTSLAAGATNPGEAPMQHAKGEFEVQITPRELDGPTEDPGLSRLAIVKQLRGDLVGTGHGQMLASGGPPNPSGAYVAIERISGSLKGKQGSFVLMHRGTMDASGSEILVTVVPDSGTGDLTGIRGTFKILVEEGKHLYDFEYALP